ncbi:MAG: hypothetical protein ACFFB1_12865 [Promethearchaeota archaeon]
MVITDFSMYNSNRKDTYYRFVDTETDSWGRSALSQAISYAICNYMEVFTLSTATAEYRTEVRYVTELTWQSTLWSSLILTPVSIVAMGASPAQALITAAMIPVSAIVEVYEKLYLDPFIEHYTERIVTSLGGDVETESWISTLITSFREAFMG